MCRSIVTLRRRDEMASRADIDAAALQFVRKISGYRKPSARDEAAFERAVVEIAESSRQLLEALTGETRGNHGAIVGGAGAMAPGNGLHSRALDPAH